MPATFLAQGAARARATPGPDRDFRVPHRGVPVFLGRFVLLLGLLQVADARLAGTRLERVLISSLTVAPTAAGVGPGWRLRLALQRLLACGALAALLVLLAARRL